MKTIESLIIPTFVPRYREFIRNFRKNIKKINTNEDVTVKTLADYAKNKRIKYRFKHRVEDFLSYFKKLYPIKKGGL
jgi:hypothetical protein